MDRDKPVAGTFCWSEVDTTDQRAAVKFYGTLFGWSVDELPMGPGEIYAMFQLRAREVAAATTMRPEQRQQGIPPHWNSYVAVESADAAADRASQLGGRVLAPPFDVFEAGRATVLQDPCGAVVHAWQAKNRIGARVLNEPGAVCWTELMTTDAGAAQRFYTSLFEWTADTSDMGKGVFYTQFMNKGAAVGGMMQISADMGPIPPHWRPYFQVEDCDQTTTRATGLGSQVQVPPTDIPSVGRFSILADPQGAAFALLRPLQV